MPDKEELEIRSSVRGHQVHLSKSRQNISETQGGKVDKCKDKGQIFIDQRTQVSGVKQSNTAGVCVSDR